MLFKHLICKSIKQINRLLVLRNCSQTSFHNNNNKTEDYLIANKLVDTNDSTFLRNIYVFEDFLTENEEKSLLNEIEPYMKKLRYEFDHWDDVNYLKLISLYLKFIIK